MSADLVVAFVTWFVLGYFVVLNLGYLALNLLSMGSLYRGLQEQVLDELPQVFERHFRGRQAREARPEGSGLGLPIAQALARAHGGHVDLQSRVGQGTRARLVLPLAVAAEARA